MISGPDSFDFPSLALDYLSSIYIKKNVCLSVCLSVCLFAMRFHNVQPISMKLSRNDLYIQEKVDVYFVQKKNESYACYRQSMKLTNRIAGFQNVKGTGSEGGRRPSEWSFRTFHMFHLPMATLQATCTTDQ